MRAIISKPHDDENFTTGSVLFRIGYLHSLVGSIEVDDGEVRIKGSKDLIEKAVLATQTGSSGCSQMSTSGAPGRIKVRTPTPLLFLYKIRAGGPGAWHATPVGKTNLESTQIGRGEYF
jgi:hypothetical protein